MIRQNQQLGQKQLLKLAPQQIQLLNFIQLNTIELEQKINDEIEENPALEAAEATQPDANETLPNDDASADTVAATDEDYDRFELLDQYHQDDSDVPDYRTATEQRSEPEMSFAGTLTAGKDFREQVKEQLAVMSLSPREMLLVGYLVDSLDDDGYLRQTLADVADNLSFAHHIFVEEEELEAALEILQTLEPVGLGARDLRECLQLQLGSMNHQHEGAQLAWEIVDNHLTDFANHNYEKLLQITGASHAQLRQAADIIERLNPRPVAGDSGGQLFKNQNIIPEFLVEKTESGDFRIALTQGSTRELRLSSDMTEMLSAMQRNKKNSQERAAAQYLRSKVDSALWFMEMVRQREQSMLKTMQAIVRLQRDYFITGEVKDLHPMILKDVAAQTNLDISTISRVTSAKYAMTDFGIVHLKDLFNQGFAKTDGEMVTNKEISDIVASMIQEEDKRNPITDQEIADALATRGYTVARRTVAKYRDAMNIPMAKMRKVLTATN